MKAWQIVSLGKNLGRRVAVCLMGFIAMLKIGPMVVMALSMVLSIAVYALAFGIKFAIGFVVLLTVHELGHVLAARVVGLRVSSPVFIPFIGAVIRIKGVPVNAKMEANVAIGGPALGTLAALLFLAAYFWSESTLFLVLSYTGCLLNLFNLIPCDPLDGGRIAAAISPRLWWMGSIVIAILFLYTYNFFIFIIFLVSLVRLWYSGDNNTSHYYDIAVSQRISVVWWYFGLVFVLGMTTWYISGVIR